MNTTTQWAVVLLCTATGFAAGCSGGSGDAFRPPDVLDGERKLDPDFATTLVIKDATGQFRDTFSPGEQVVFELTITNLRDRTITVTRGSGQIFDFLVAPAGTRDIVWRQSAGFLFAQVIEHDEFAAHETRTYSVNWDQDRDDGLPLLPGEYVARGVYAAVGSGFEFQQSELGSELIPFAIR